MRRQTNEKSNDSIQLSQEEVKEALMVDKDCRDLNEYLLKP